MKERKQLEDVIIGALILERDAYYEVCDILTSNDFHYSDNKSIYESIISLIDENKPIDLVTISHVNKHVKPHEIAGKMNHVNSAANIRHHAALLKEYSIKDKLLFVADSIKGVIEKSESSLEALHKVEKMVFDISLDLSTSKDPVDSELVASEVIEDLNSDELPVTLSGFDNYDLSEGHLEIIAGRPAQGKSSFAMNIAENVCRSGKKVLVFSLEMTRKELAKRMLSSMSDIPFAAIKNKDIKQYQQETFQATINEFSNMEIFIDDSTGLSIEEVAAKAMKMKMKHGIDLVVVDYLQLLKTQRPTENRALEITKIAYGLKNISKDIKVPVIALSQLNRSVESRGGDKIPQLSDLKESGGIEEAADRVGFMYRPEYYGIMEDADGISTEGLAFVVVAKNRHGETGSLSLNFEGKYMRFTDRKTINTDEAF